jgi:hypothetical protein
VFDYVVGNNLLDLKNAGWVLQEVQNLLRPGGRLLCSRPTHGILSFDYEGS